MNEFDTFLRLRVYQRYGLPHISNSINPNTLISFAFCKLFPGEFESSDVNWLTT